MGAETMCPSGNAGADGAMTSGAAAAGTGAGCAAGIAASQQRLAEQIVRTDVSRVGRHDTLTPGLSRAHTIELIEAQ